MLFRALAGWAGPGFLCFLFAPVAWGQSAALRTGDDFARQLQTSAGVAWSGVPLRAALESLGREQGIAVLLDRRVDPGQSVSLAVAPQPLEHVLTTIARHMNLGVCHLDSVVYVGPAATARILPTVAAMRRHEAERLPRDAAQRFARARPWSWRRLSEPRDLFAELVEEGGVEVANWDALPHDLWPAVELPPLPLADRMTLVLAGFGLTFELSPNGKALQLTALPETAAITRTYPGKGHARENAERIGRLYPEASIRVEGETIRVVGPWETHQGVEQLMQGRRVARTVEPPKKSPGRTVYTLKVENEPVGGVVNALAEQLKLRVTLAPAAEAKLTERVSFNVSDVSREELLKAVLQPAGLTFRLRGDELEIRASE